jgi:hypothetical protein
VTRRARLAEPLHRAVGPRAADDADVDLAGGQDDAERIARRDRDVEVLHLVHGALARDHRHRREGSDGDADPAVPGGAEHGDPRLLGACDALGVHARRDEHATLRGRDRRALERELAEADALPGCAARHLARVRVGGGAHVGRAERDGRLCLLGDEQGRQGGQDEEGAAEGHVPPCAPRLVLDDS